MKFRTKSLKEIFEIIGGNCNWVIPLDYQEIIADRKVRTGVFDNIADRILFDENGTTYSIPQSFVKIVNEWEDIEELFEL